MRRLTLAAALIACVAVVAGQGTFAGYSRATTSSSSFGTSSSFAPVNSALPTVSGSVAALGTLTAGSGTWGYTHAAVSGLDTSADPAVTTARQWQVCPTGLVASCVDISGETGSTLSLTSSLLTSLGLGVNLAGIAFRVKETASNDVAAAAPVYSSLVSG